MVSEAAGSPLVGMLRRRAALLAAVRDFFARHEVLEVETPLLSPAANTDPALDSFESRWEGPGGPFPLWLQTSPEPQSVSAMQSSRLPHAPSWAISIPLRRASQALP